MTQFVALERNAGEGNRRRTWPRHTTCLPAGRLDAFYAPLVVDDERSRRGSRTAELRDRHAAPRPRSRRLGFGPEPRFARPSERGARSRSSAPARGRGALRGRVLRAFRSEADLVARATARGSTTWRRASAHSSGSPPPASAARGGTRREELARPAAGVRADAHGPRSWLSSRSRSRSSGSRPLGWPMAKGRDTWDYLVYYLQLFDSDPPLSQVQLFRAPAHAARRRAADGSRREPSCSRSSSACSSPVSVVAWSATALTFGRIPALASAVLLLVYPAWATLYHQASSDAVFTTGLAVWALILARTMRRPSTRGFVALGLGLAALVLIRPANQVLLPAVLAPLLAAAVPWRRRLTWVAACCAAAVLPLAAWAVHNGVRYDDLTVTRGGRAWVPFLRVFTADRSIAPENGPASRRLGRPRRGRGPHRGAVQEPRRPARRVPRERVELRDRPADRALRPGARPRQNYDVLFDSAVEAIRERPRDVRARCRRRLLGVPHAAAAARERRAARADRAGAAAADVRERRRRAPEPPGAHPRRRRPVRLRLVRLRLHRLVHPSGPVGRLGRSRRPAAVSRGRLPGAGLGRRAPVPDRRGVADGDPQPDHAAVPAAAALARRRRRRARLAAAAGLADDRRPLGVRGRRAPDPRRLAGRRPRVRAPALSALHRHRPRRRSRGTGGRSARRRADAPRRPVAPARRRHARRRGAALRDARRAELLAGRARHGLAARPRPRRRARGGSALGGDAVRVLRRRLALGPGLRARRGGPPVALGARRRRRRSRSRTARARRSSRAARASSPRRSSPRTRSSSGTRRRPAPTRSSPSSARRRCSRSGMPCAAAAGGSPRGRSSPRSRSRRTTSPSSSSRRRRSGCSSGSAARGASSSRASCRGRRSWPTSRCCSSSAATARRSPGPRSRRGSPGSRRTSSSATASPPRRWGARSPRCSCSSGSRCSCASRRPSGAGRSSRARSPPPSSSRRSCSPSSAPTT